MAAIGGGNTGVQAQKTSDARAWRPGMIYVSPVTGKQTSNPADVPYTAAWNARQATANTGRYTGGNSVVPLPPSTTTATRATTTASYGSQRAVGDGGAAAAAAAAQQAATNSANSSARSSATSQKNALQQAIDAALAQKGTNQSKLDALTGLVTTGLQSGRDVGLKGVENDLKTLLDQAFQNYNAALGDVNTGLRDNEKSESDSSFGNLANRAREKQDLVGQALSQGAGESDVLKTQLQALRNWNSNQGEINRSYFDTLTSTNGTLTDLNVGNKSTMTGYEMDANQRKGGIWGDYYSGLADSYTQMDNLATNNYLLDKEIGANQANISGQDALLGWLAAGKNADAFTPTAVAAQAPGAYKGYAADAAQWAGKAWENPGVSEATKNWEGQQAVVSPLSNSQAWAAQTNSADKGSVPKKPEGATLRKW